LSSLLWFLSQIVAGFDKYVTSATIFLVCIAYSSIVRETLYCYWLELRSKFALHIVICSVEAGKHFHYYYQGGLKGAVLWTDALQALIMFGTMITVVAAGMSEIGGFRIIWERAEQAGRTDLVK
jgi:Na+/proline symporter